jgi:protein TonB
MPSPIFTTPAINLAGYIAANLKYPEAAIKQNLSGNVKLGFVVEPHGKISNLMILNSLGAGCNEEAIRLVRLIKWMPGIKNDLAVRTRMSISINFSLESGPEGNFNPNIKSSYGGY